MGGRLGMRRKGLEDLNVYRIQQEREAKVREDLNVQRLLRCFARDRPSRYGCRGAFFFVARGPSRLYQRDAGFPASPPLPPQSRPHPGHPGHLGHPASDARDIKVLTDLFCLLLLRVYRHSGPIGPGAECWCRPSRG